MIVVVATILSYFAKALKQPLILAYLLAGILLGPIGLGALNLSFAGFSIGFNNFEEILVFSELGIAFLLFGVGVETNFSKFLGFGKTILVGGIVQVALTVLFVLLASSFFGVLDFSTAILLGLVIAFSSTAIVVKILSDSHQIGTIHGKLLVGFLLVQDLLVIVALPFIKNFESLFSFQAIFPLALQALLILGFAFVLNKFVYPRVFVSAAKSDELLFLLSVSSCFVFILVGFLLGFSIAISAFVAGVALSTLPYNFEVFHRIKGLRDFFSTVFFVTLGMQISISFAQIPLLVVFILLFAVFLFKPIVFFLITLFSGYGSRASLSVGLALAQISEFSFIIASQSKSVFDHYPGLYSMVILVTAVSMGVTPYVVKETPSIFNFFKRVSKKAGVEKYLRSFSSKIAQIEGQQSDLVNHVVVVGAGAVGFPLAKELSKNNGVVVVDHDVDAVYNSQKHGLNSLYGSADNLEVFHKANVSKAKAIVLAIPDFSSAVFLAKFAKKENPSIAVFGRAHYYSQTLALYEAGADFVVMPHVIGSEVFLQNISSFLTTGKTLNLQNVDSEYLRFVREQAWAEKSRGGLPV